MRIFISYTHSNGPEVSLLAQQLKEIGHHVIIDESDLRYGVRIADEIIRKLEGSDIFLQCHSRYLRCSDWANWEAGIATYLEKKGTVQFQLLKLDETEIGAYNAGRLHLDVSNELKDPQLLRSKLRSLFPEKSKGFGFNLGRFIVFVIFVCIVTFLIYALVTAF